MKTVTKTVIVILIVILAGGFVSVGGKGLKKPLNAYLTQAKIEIVEGRPKEAAMWLDSIAVHYGPHAEALYLMGQVMIDLLETTSGAANKAPYVEKMVAYFDSLHMCCANKEIKKGYRKNCDENISVADSAIGKYWHQFYITGREKLDAAQKSAEQLKSETDSSLRSYIEKDLNTSTEASIQNMKLSIAIIPDSSQPYLALGRVYELTKDFQAAIEWYQKGLEKSADRLTFLMSIAYDYIMLDQYCEAIPYYKELVELAPDNVGTMVNLSICYNNCGIYDSAMTVYHKILTVEPENTNILSNIGLYYNTVARFASDSASKYQQQENDELTAMWRGKRRDAFDSSRVYFKRTFELKPDDANIAEQYAIVCALLGDCEEAVIGFGRIAELEPQRPDNWTSLGDCYLTLQQFDNAIAAYEKVVELEPDNIPVWEHLKDLYFETGQNAKHAEAEKKLNELKQ